MSFFVLCATLSRKLRTSYAFTKVIVRVRLFMPPSQKMQNRISCAGQLSRKNLWWQAQSSWEFLILSYCYHATMERTASKDWPQAIHIALIKNNLYWFYISLINKKKHFPGFIELTWNDQFFLRGRCHQTYMLNFFMKNSCPVLRRQNNI